MDTITLQNLIKEKLTDTFAPQKIELIDETDKHRKHRHFQPDKFHFQLIIQSSYLASLPKIKAHQAIYHCLDELMKTYIHALSIQINP
ncbi:BolA family protein [Facilibium subflavum]|uniref:BolA family protein n=1 Tax=Facilibium subflavum TaxID=2219058 RepID=UPI0013C2DD31|nr:BolA family protein [Facilibium subflavum]